MAVGLAREEVHVPELDDSIVVREMSMAELDEYWSLAMKEGSSLQDRFRFVLKHALVEPEPDDDLVEHLLKKASRETVFTPILNACQRINGMLVEDDAASEDV